MHRRMAAVSKTSCNTESVSSLHGSGPARHNLRRRPRLGDLTSADIDQPSGFDVEQSPGASAGERWSGRRQRRRAPDPPGVLVREDPKSLPCLRERYRAFMYLNKASRSSSSSSIRLFTTSPMLTIPARAPSSSTGT